VPRLTLMRAFAADPAVTTFAGQSRGAMICILSGLAIKPNEIAYEIATARSAITVEVNCYQTFLQQRAEVRASCSGRA